MQYEIPECFDSVNDALKSAVKALGGMKKVGPKVRPELDDDAAGNWLRDCLNPERRERLSPEQLMLLLRLARAANYHAAADYIMFDVGYKATPIDPKSQEEELQSRFIEAVTALSSIKADLERVQRLRAVS